MEQKGDDMKSYKQKDIGNEKSKKVLKRRKQAQTRPNWIYQDHLIHNSSRNMGTKITELILIVFPIPCCSFSTYAEADLV